MVPSVRQTNQPIKVLHAVHTRVSLEVGRGWAAGPPRYASPLVYTPRGKDPRQRRRSLPRWPVRGPCRGLRVLPGAVTLCPGPIPPSGNLAAVSFGGAAELEAIIAPTLGTALDIDLLRCGPSASLPPSPLPRETARGRGVAWRPWLAVGRGLPGWLVLLCPVGRGGCSCPRPSPCPLRLCRQPGMPLADATKSVCATFRMPGRETHSPRLCGAPTRGWPSWPYLQQFATPCRCSKHC